MPVAIRIPSPLRPLAAGREEVVVESGTVEEALTRLEALHPGFRERLCDSSGALRRFINLYVNGSDIRDLAGLKTELRDGDAVSIIPAIAGGGVSRA